MNTEPSNVVFVTNGLKEMEARNVGEVGNTSYSLKHVESLVGLILVKNINDSDQKVY